MKSFTVSGKIFRYPGVGGWHFVYVDKKLSEQIKKSTTTKKVGWAFVKVRLTISKTSWESALFPTKEGPYMVAVKANVRKKEGILEGDTVKIKGTLL